MRLLALLPALVFVALPAVAAELPTPSYARLSISSTEVAAPSGATATTDIQTFPPANGLFSTGLGTYLQYCSFSGCLPGPHLLAQSALFATTRLDASAQESGFAINLASITGRALAWTANTGYAVGTEVHGPTDNIYRATTAGTSGVSGPTGTGLYSDGTVQWQYVGPGLNDGKTALPVSTHLMPGGGHSWVTAFDLVIDAGVGPVPAFVSEFDSNNANQDYPIGGQIMAGIFQNGSAQFPGTAAMYTTLSGGIATYGWHIGHLWQGDQLIKDDTVLDATSSTNVFHAGAGHTHSTVFRDESNSQVALGVNNSHGSGVDFSGATFSIAGINDPSTSPALINSSGTKSLAEIILGAATPNAITISGAKSAADINDTATGPIALDITGTHQSEDILVSTSSPAAYVSAGSHSNSAFLDISTANIGLSLAGTYAGAQINGRGFSVDPAGNVAGANLRSTVLAGAGTLAVCATSNGTLYTHAVGGC